MSPDLVLGKNSFPLSHSELKHPQEPCMDTNDPLIGSWGNYAYGLAFDRAPSLFRRGCGLKVTYLLQDSQRDYHILNVGDELNDHS